MVSLWGSSKDDNNPNGSGSVTPREGEEAQSQSQSQRPASGSRRDPDERTRLLPRRPPPPNSDGYLDPDDPAVSANPYYSFVGLLSADMHHRSHHTIYGLCASSGT